MSSALPPAGSPEAAITAWPGLGACSVAPLGAGLINATWAVEADAGRFVLQRVSPVFQPAIHDDIRAVTERLEVCGLATPRLVPAADGGLWSRGPDGGVWRLMTRVAGVTFDRGCAPGQARAAGTLVARFHAALDGLDHVFAGRRAGVHDTPAHLANLRQALSQGAGHRLYGRVAPLGDAIFAAAEALPRLDGPPARPCHGDLKLNNVVFAGVGPEERERAVCLVDLDTVGPLPLHFELGDAWRSWCNAAGEDSASASFDEGVFEASVSGYAGAAPRRCTPEEREALLYGVEWITVELAARFAADALQERYFGWSERFGGRGEHGLLRAQGQLALHRLVVAARGRRERVIAGM